jgi:hypothetical protein
MKYLSSLFSKRRRTAGLHCFLFLFFWLFFQASPAGAITLSATPASIQLGDSVHVAISMYFDPLPPASNGYAEVDYGDGGGWHNVGLGTSPDGVTYYININHRYDAAGTYTVRVRYQRGGLGAPGPNPSPPLNVSRTVVVNAELVFTRIQVYFKNRESKLFVKRNQRNIEAAVDLRYEGSGLFKGYWQADDRILAQVVKNLTYANNRTFTLKLPPVPPLPTHSIGSHRLRFVITEPKMNITFPEIIYVVTGEDLVNRHPIRLGGPADDAVLNSSGFSFSWQEKPGVASYRVDFFGPDGKEVVFSAYSREPAYSVPASVVDSRFEPNAKYSWRVIGLDENDLPVAESRMAGFSFMP